MTVGLSSLDKPLRWILPLSGPLDKASCQYREGVSVAVAGAGPTRVGNLSDAVRQEDAGRNGWSRPA